MNGLQALFCCKSAWSAARWGWFSILCTSSWTRRCSDSFTTECHSPGTQKSMSCSSTFTGHTVLVWSSSIFVGVNTQLFVESDPHTGLPVLVECLTSSWSNIVRFSISFVDSCSHTGLSVLDNWVFGFGWIRWVSLLFPATSESNSFIPLSL